MIDPSIDMQSEEEKIDEKTERLQQRMWEVKSSWFNGILVFAALVISFLAGEAAISARLLLIGYFLLALLVLINLFIFDSVYTFLKKNFLKFSDLAEKERSENIRTALDRGRLSDKIDDIAKKFAIVLVALTIIYLICGLFSPPSYGKTLARTQFFGHFFSFQPGE